MGDGAEMGPLAPPTRMERIGPTRLGTASPARGSRRPQYSQTRCRQGLGERTLFVDMSDVACLTSHARKLVKVLLEHLRFLGEPRSAAASIAFPAAAIQGSCAKPVDLRWPHAHSCQLALHMSNSLPPDGRKPWIRRAGEVVQFQLM